MDFKAKFFTYKLLIVFSVFIVNLNIQAAAKITSKDQIEKFAQAVIDGNLEKTEKFIQEGIDVNAKDSRDEIVLKHAIHKNHLEIIKLLIKNKADVNIITHNCSTLGQAILNPEFDFAENVEMVKILIDAGADINNNGNQRAPLTTANVYGQNNIMRLLLYNGAELREDYKIGWLERNKKIIQDKPHRTAVYTDINNLLLNEDKRRENKIKERKDKVALLIAQAISANKNENFIAIGKIIANYETHEYLDIPKEDRF